MFLRGAVGVLPLPSRLSPAADPVSGWRKESNCWPHRPHHRDAPGIFDYIQSLLLWRIRGLIEEQVSP